MAFTGVCKLGIIKSSQPFTFLHFWRVQYTHRKLVYQNLSIQDYLVSTSDALRAVYDCFVDNGDSAATWRLDVNGSIVRGVNTIPISSNTLDPKRSKLGGIYTILRITECMVDYYTVESVAIEIRYEGSLKHNFFGKILSLYRNYFHLDITNPINNSIRSGNFGLLVNICNTTRKVILLMKA